MSHSREADPKEQEDQRTALKGFLRYAFGIGHRAGLSAPMKGIHRNPLDIRYGRAERPFSTAGMQNASSGKKKTDIFSNAASTDELQPKFQNG